MSVEGNDFSREDNNVNNVSHTRRDNLSILNIRGALAVSDRRGEELVLGD